VVVMGAPHKFSKNKMTKELADFFRNALEYAGEDAEVREDYSGRGMFGKTTVGIVFISSTLLMAAVLDYVRETKAEIQLDFKSIRQDNIGRGIIWY